MPETKEEISAAKAQAQATFTKMAGATPEPNTEALKELFAKDDAAAEDNPKPPAAPKPEAKKHEPDPKPEKVEPQAEADDEHDEEELKAARLEALRSPLFTPEMVDALSPADLLATAARAAEARKERDREIRAIKDAQKASAPENPASPALAVPDASPVDLSEAASPLLVSLGADDADTRKSLVDFVQRAIDSAVAPLKAELAQEREAVQGLSGRTLVDKTRTELGGRYPELVDDAVYEAKIEPSVQKLLKTGDYGPENATQLLKDAYLLGMGRSPRPPVADNRERDKKRAAGQPTPVRSSRDVPIPQSPRERAYAKFMDMAG